MSKRNRTLAVVGLVLSLFIGALAVGQETAGLGSGLAKVLVANFPETWQVEGEVAVRGPVSHAAFLAQRDIQVPPVSRADTTRLVAGGTVTTDGFSAVVLSLTGQIKGEVLRPGTVGVLLLPDDETVEHALDEQGQVLFPMEAIASSVSGRLPYFASEQPRFQVAFPRYRAYFYNTTDKSATVSFFAYLTN